MASLESLIEDLASRLARGVSLEDLDGLLLAYSANQTHADSVRIEFLLAKRVPTAVAEWQRSHGIEQSVRPVVIPANPGLGMSPRVCIPLLDRGFRVGYVWVQLDDDADAPFLLSLIADAAPLLRELAQLILETNTGQTEHRRSKEALFLAACRGRQNALGAVADWPEIHGTGPWQLAAMTMLAPASGEQGASSARASRSERLALAGDDVDIIHRTAALHATLGRERAVFSAGSPTYALVLFTAQGPGADPGARERGVVGRAYAEEARARGSLRGGRLVVGSSETFQDLAALPARHAQAMAALQALAVDPAAAGDRQGAVERSTEQAVYRGLGVYQFLAGARLGQSPVKSSNYAVLQRQPDGGELLELLEQMYERSESVAELAQRLHIHRSSVYNRLARVRSLIGADPLVGSVRLELHLALKAARWERRPRL